ncbi:MAG: hypothetical protein L0Y54_20075 [Sporichthyaceae bacterium]|nr:hypothetical protein [Sporichthyaceae bacterium]
MLCRAGRQLRLAQSVAYTGSPDTTITGSRSGHAPLLLWYAIRKYGVDGLRRRAEESRKLAGYALRRLTEIGWDAFRNPHAFTVVLRTPPAVVTKRWVLATSDGWSHIVCMPWVTRDQIDEFVADLQATTDRIPAGTERMATGTDRISPTLDDRRPPASTRRPSARRSPRSSPSVREKSA